MIDRTCLIFFILFVKARSDGVDLERLAARKFLQDLQTFLQGLNFLRSPLEVDMAIQSFASNYCQSAYNPRA